MYQLVVVEWRSLDGACPFNPISHGGNLPIVGHVTLSVLDRVK